MNTADLVYASAWSSILLWNTVIIETHKRTFLFWLQMALFISKAVLSYCVRIWNLLCGMGNLSCLMDLLFYFFTKWMKKLYFGPHCRRIIKSGIAFYDFLWHIDSEKSKVAILFSLAERFLLLRYVTPYSTSVKPLNLLPSFYLQRWNNSKNASASLLSAFN